MTGYNSAGDLQTRNYFKQQMEGQMQHMQQNLGMNTIGMRSAVGRSL